MLYILSIKQGDETMTNIANYTNNLISIIKKLNNIGM